MVNSVVMVPVLGEPLSLLHPAFLHLANICFLSSGSEDKEKNVILPQRLVRKKHNDSRDIILVVR